MDDDTLTSRLHQQGYVVIDDLLQEAQLVALSEAVQALSPAGKGRGGVRRLLARSPAIRHFATHGPPARLADRVLGEGARPVKATLFDKNPDANWQVRLHQDRTIAVEERIDVEGFGPWSVKDGEVHAQPPAAILQQILAVRVHLDAADADNGALRVVPGSHRHGKLAASESLALRDRRGEVICPVAAGGAMAMFPLLLHASSKCREPRSRRVVHIEYSAIDLPAGLKWVSLV